MLVCLIFGKYSCFYGFPLEVSHRALDSAKPTEPNLAVDESHRQMHFSNPEKRICLSRMLMLLWSNLLSIFGFDFVVLGCHEP